MLTTTPLTPGNHRSYVRWNTSLDRLAEQADELKSRGCADTCELRATESGLSNSGEGPALPLSLGEFRQAVAAIEKSDDWLTDRDNVSIYRDSKAQTHIDVVNFGGFIVAGGQVVSRSVNAW